MRLGESEDGLPRPSIKEWDGLGRPSSTARNRAHAARQGAVLIAALLCLALLGVMGGALLRWAAMEHKMLRGWDEQSQARWLAEAGVERAAARLAGDADYAGETWNIAVAGEAARVRIEVTSIANAPRRSAVAVEAVYPLDSPSPARAYKEIIHQLLLGEEE